MPPVQIPEAYRRVRSGAAIQFQLELPAMVLPADPERLWGAVQVGTPVGLASVGLSTNPYAQQGDADVALFPFAQGACYFQTGGTNALYLIGLPVGTPVAASWTCKQPPFSAPVARSVRPATRVETRTSAIPIVYSGGSALLLPEDPTRLRVTVRTDAVFAALTTAEALASFDFMSIGPFFPGWATLETTEEIRLIDFSLGGTVAWVITDHVVPANV